MTNSPTPGAIHHRARQLIPVIRLADLEGPPTGNDLMAEAAGLLTAGHLKQALDLAQRMKDDAMNRRDLASLEFPTHGVWCGFVIAARAAWWGR